ncbi:hypothetical protein [Labedaea rhizosphaerae]|nr:hypothetical protein [Labedaea rhizosphaerae]
MREHLRLAIGACLVVAASAATVGVAAGGTPIRTRQVSLVLDYSVAQACDVHPNYPGDRAPGNDIGWRIAPGDTVAWLYNADATWSVVADDKYRDSTAHPAWGFVRRDCIGTSLGGEAFPTSLSRYPSGRVVPLRELEGRSAVTSDHYRPVTFRPSAGRVTGARTVLSMGTLRDTANRFVIGTVFPGWHVRVTDEHSSGWTKVYVPHLKRWGWVEDTHFALPGAGISRAREGSPRPPEGTPETSLSALTSENGGAAESVDN